MRKTISLTLVFAAILPAVSGTFGETLEAHSQNGLYTADADSHLTNEQWDDTFKTPGDREYPRGYTHRPLIALYTSLSCPSCMDNAEPAYQTYWQENGYVEGQPVNLVVFHLHAGGNRDDPLWTEEGSQWADHQNIIGTPTFLVDEGYRNPSPSYNDLKQAVEESGNRDGTPGAENIPGGQGEAFRETEIRVWSMYSNGTFHIQVWVEYIGKHGGNPLINQDLNGLINICMVEDNVTAYSSEIQDNVTCHNAFRGFAAQEDVTLRPGEEWSGNYTWEVPDLDPEEDNVVPINVQNVFPVAVVYDKDDTSSGGAQGWPGATRCVNSATPRSTVYDLGITPPKVENVTAENGKIHIKFDRAVIGGFVAYNTISENYTGEWKTAALMISEDGMEGNVSLNVKRDVYYQIVFYDANWTEGKTGVMTMPFSSSTIGVKAGEGIGVREGIIALLIVAALAVFVFRDRLPVKISGLSGSAKPASAESVSTEKTSSARIPTDTESSMETGRAEMAGGNKVGDDKKGGGVGGVARDVSQEKGEKETGNDGDKKSG